MLTTLRLKSNALSPKFSIHNARLNIGIGQKSGLRLYSSFPRQQSFLPFFTKSRVPLPSIYRRLLWALPVAGGIILYLSPRKPLLLSSVFSSPKLIPIKSPTPEYITRGQLVINSPDEEGRSLFSRIRRIFNEWLIEPILTASRFIHLFCIFVPVILASPALLIGEIRPKNGGERSGAIWWYDYLVNALGRAGPTFIKVCGCNRFP